jgi:hypothetical protein
VVWSVQRDSDAWWKHATDKVLVCADYELLDDEEAVKLAAAIIDVATGQAYYCGEGGTRYETRSEYEDRD